jgi:hypothetical protein
MVKASSYIRQNDLPKSTNTVIISNLPIIIRRLKTTLLISGKPEKLLIGPTVPSPGPIPAIQVATEVEADIRSNPEATIITVPVMNIKM